MMSTDKKKTTAGEGEPMFSLSLPYIPTPIDLEERKTSTSDVEGRKLSSISIPSGPSVGSVASNGPSNSFDLTGKTTIKAQLADDIRRMPIHNEEMTYDELLLMMQRIFKGSLKSDDDVLVKYKDEDGDLVTISDTTDLTLAIQTCPVLNIKLILKDKKEEARRRKVADVPVRLIRSELKELRERVNKILDYLDQDELGMVMPIAAKVTAVSTGAQTAEKDQRQTSTVNMNGMAIGSPEDDKPVSVAVAEVPVKDFDVIFQQKPGGAGIDASQSSMLINGGATPKSAQLPEQHRLPQSQQVTQAFQSSTVQSQTPISSSVSTPSKQMAHERQQQVHQQPHASSLFDNSGMSPAKLAMEHGMMMGTSSQPLPQAHQTNRYPTGGPTTQSMPSMMGITGAGSSVSGVNVQQQQQPAAQPQPGAYQQGSNAAYPQYGAPYHASASPAQNYGNTGPAVQYPTTPQPSRPTGASYPSGGPDTGTATGYPQMPPVSSTMPTMNAHNPSGTVPNANVPPMPQQYAPPPQQYSSGMPPAMPSYRPQGPPPPSAAAGMGSNPYSRSAVPPPLVQTYRPQM